MDEIIERVTEFKEKINFVFADKKIKNVLK